MDVIAAYFMALNHEEALATLVLSLALEIEQETDAERKAVLISIFENVSGAHEKYTRITREFTNNGDEAAILSDLRSAGTMLETAVNLKRGLKHA